MAVEFILVIVDDDRQAAEINATYEHINDAQFRGYAIAAGTAICGLRHGSSRPTSLVNCATDLNPRWFRECVQPALDPDARIIDITDSLPGVIKQLRHDVHDVIRNVARDLKLYALLDWICDKHFKGRN